MEMTTLLFFVFTEAKGVVNVSFSDSSQSDDENDEDFIPYEIILRSPCKKLSVYFSSKNLALSSKLYQAFYCFCLESVYMSLISDRPELYYNIICYNI